MLILYNKLNKNIGGSGAFTLLELLIVLIIISTLLVITYPKIKDFILYSGTNPYIFKTKRTIDALLRKKYGKLAGKDVYVKFDFKRDEMAVLYKKGYKLMPLKTIRKHIIKFKGIKLYGILPADVSAGNLSCSANINHNNNINANKKPVYIWISPSVSSYSYCIYFKNVNNGKKTALLLDPSMGNTQIIN